MQGSLDILQIPDNIGYWLVRADGGKYFDDFLQNNFIAISDNEITLEMIRNIDDESLAGVTKEHYKKLYEETFGNWKPQQIAHAAGRTQRFMDEMKKGDIVLVPSRRSTHFLIGIIDSDPYELKPEDIQSKTEVHYLVNPYYKRRNVHWIKLVPREDISEKLYWVLSAHQTIFDLKEDKEYINQLLSPIYIQNGICQGTLKISKKEGLTSEEWVDLYSVINQQSKMNEQEIIVKSNVQSPGLITLVSVDPATVITTAIVLSGIAFGRIKVWGIDLKGIVPSIQDYRKKDVEIKKEDKEIEILEEERVYKQLTNERLKFELERDKELWENEKIKKEAELVRERLRITNFDAGKPLSSVQKQMEKNDIPDEE